MQLYVALWLFLSICMQAFSCLFLTPFNLPSTISSSFVQCCSITQCYLIHSPTSSPFPQKLISKSGNPSKPPYATSATLDSIFTRTMRKPATRGHSTAGTFTWRSYCTLMLLFSFHLSASFIPCRCNNLVYSCTCHSNVGKSITYSLKHLTHLMSLVQHSLQLSVSVASISSFSIGLL